MARSNEPIVWSLFAAGGMIAAILGPITIVLTGIAVPAGWITADGLLDLVRHPLGRLYIFLLIVPPLFHAAHRFRFTLVDMGLKGLKGILPVLCYGAATAGSLFGAYLLITL